MAYDNFVSIVGNVVREPEFRLTQAGHAVVSLTVAWNPKEGDPVFFPVTCWRDLANNVADTVVKGARVHVQGYLKTSKWESKDGESRERMEIVADELSLSQRFASKTAGKPKATATTDTYNVVPLRESDEVPF